MVVADGHDAYDGDGGTNSLTRSFRHLDPVVFAFSATILCWLRTAVQHPLTLVLTKQQVGGPFATLTTVEALRQVTGQHGVRGLLLGMPAYTAGSAVSEGIYLTAFEALREKLFISNTMTREAAAGYLADAACRIVHIPLLVVAVRQMTRPACAAMNVSSVARSVLRENGWSGLFAGFGSTLVIGCQWTGVWWAVYGVLKRRIYAVANEPLSRLPAEYQTLPWCSLRDNVVINTLASIGASSFSALLFNPFLVCRTRMQADGCGLRMACQRIGKESNVRGFFRGARLNVLLGIVDGWLASMSYEYAKLWSDVSVTAPSGAC